MPISRPLLGRAKRYLADAARAFERAPVEVVLAVLIALTSSWAIEGGSSEFQEWARVATAGAVAIAGAWSGTLLHGLGAISPARRWTITAIGVLLAILLAVFALDFEHRSENWRALLLLCAAAAWLIALPAFAAKDQRNLTMRRVDGRFLVRAMGATLYALALFLGLALALRAIDTLFELSLRGEIYGHVFAWLMLGLVPWVTFGGLPDYVRPLGEVSAVTTGVHRLTRFLVPPLLAIYYLILYAYAVRIAVVGELPKNLVSPMVIAAGLLVGAALLLFDPERDDPGGMGALRFAPPLLLPLAALGFWSLWPRIQQYGWTEFRVARFVLLIVLAALASAGTVLVFRRRRLPLHFIPLAIALVLALASVGPLSVLAVSRRSQQEQLGQALTAAGLRSNSNVAAPATTSRTVPFDTYERINSVAQYLSSHFGEASLQGLVPEEGRRYPKLADLSAFLGLVRALSVGQRSNFSGHLPFGSTMQLGTGQIAYRLMYPMGSADTSMVVRPDSAGLVFVTGGETLRADLTQSASTLSTNRDSQVLAESAHVPVHDTAGNRRGTLIVFNITGERVGPRINVTHMDGLLLIDRASPR